MGATVTVCQLTGAKLGSGVATTRTTVSLVRLCTSDLAEPGLSFPIPRPEAGTVRSYWASLCLALGPGTFASVDNIRHDTDRGTFEGLGTGGEVKVGARNVGDWGCPDASYVQATGTPGEVGDNIEDDHDYYTAPDGDVEDLFSDEIDVDTTNVYTGTNVTQYTNHIVVQVEVANDCTSGVATAESCRFIYDDI